MTRMGVRLFDLSGPLATWRARTGAAPVVAAVRVDGALAWTSGEGPDGAAPRVPTYSILKTFTASAMLRLQEAGRVDLDAPVRRYLPEAPVAPAATLADLLRHTSGLADYGPLPAYHEA